MNSPRDITLTTTVDSPVGPLTLTSKAGRLTGLHMDGQAHAPTDRTGWARDAGAFRDITDQLTAYFAGELTEFDVDLDLAGTDFQRSVWGALRQNPLRGDVELFSARWEDRQQPRLPGGRFGQRPQPCCDHRPLPPRHRGKRVAGGLRWRA